MNSPTSDAPWKRVSLRRSPILLAVVIGLIAIAGDALAQGIRPTVTVDFDMSQSPFAVMSQSDQKEIAEAAIEKLAANATRRWGFLDWMSARDGGVTADATWTIKVEAEAKTITLPDGQQYEADIVYLNHYASIGGLPVRLYQSESAQLLYDLGEPKPVQSPEEFTEDLLRKLGEQIDLLLNGEEIESVLFRVRLSDELVFDKDNKHIIVPFRLSDLRAEQEVRFKVRLVPEQAVRDDFELEEDGAVDELGDLKGLIIARIVDWSVPSLPASTPTWWVEDLPEYVSQFDGAHIFMLEYSPSLSGAANTDNGVLLDPDQ